ncbi:MAG: hypothetical protein LC134_00530 [Chitinophagales bacterium]|nr:hypothetical protein [Chitinophagales bacterium]
MKHTKWLLSTLSLVIFAIIFWSSSTTRPAANTNFFDTDLAPAITPDAKELTRITNDNLLESYPAISPDGKKILYHSIDPLQKGSKVYHINLKILGEQGTTPLLTEGCSDASWMPDSKGFYFKYLVPTKPVLAKSKIDQGGINYVSPNASGDDDEAPSLLKAQNKILFHTKIGASYQIATIEQNGLNFTLLGTGFYPYPHPTANKFLFSKWVGNYIQIFSYDLVTGQQTQLTNGDFNYHRPRYSPDGKWIVFNKSTRKEDLKAKEVPSSHIFLMNSGGGNVRQLTTGNTWNETPEFGIDGYIYFSSNAGNTDKYRKFDNYDIWRLKPNLSE